jgi:hypothetical protein
VRRRSPAWLLLAALCALAGGTTCDLFGEDLLSWDFALPEESFTVDTGNFVPSWIQQQGVTMPAIDCPAVDCCAELSATDCATFGFGCQDDACVAVPKVELSNSINLSQQVPELNDVASNIPSFAHVTLKRLWLSRYSNTLNYDTPEIELYLCPEAATSVEDQDQGGAPLCQKLGTLAPITKGTSCSISCAADVQLTADGAQVFETFVRNFRQTFKLFAVAVSQFEPGDPIPSGQFTGTVSGTVTASM